MRDRGKLCIFVDGNSLFHAAKAVNVNIDYARLLDFLADEDLLVRASFYTGLMVESDDQYQKQAGFLHFMRRNGYRVITRELRRNADGFVRGGLEVELATDMITLAPHCDTVLLVAGTEALAYPVECVSRMGRRIELAMFKGGASQRLMELADAYVELDHAIQRIAKDPGSYTPRTRRITEDVNGHDNGSDPGGY